jgi:pSer/pThr/pTyr-binding forkhead associated (FHA) protein
VPKLVIVTKGDGDRVFDIETDQVLIGRGQDTQLMLANVSVSRHHAKIVLRGDDYYIEDLDSRNGTVVNGMRAEQATLLNSGDEIAVGKFSLAYIGDGKEDRFYKGRFVDYLPKYEAVIRTVEDSTFAMSPDELRRKQMEMEKIRDAKLVSLANPGKYWHPEDKLLTLGGDGMVLIEGMFTSGIVAEIQWNGRHHVLVKKARLLKLLVNDEPVSDRPLTNGDRVRVGNSNFRYELPRSS